MEGDGTRCEDEGLELQAAAWGSPSVSQKKKMRKEWNSARRGHAISSLEDP